MLTSQACHERAEECERDAARTTRIIEVRQYRLLARGWRELAAELEQRAPAERRSFAARG